MDLVVYNLMSCSWWVRFQTLKPNRSLINYLIIPLWFVLRYFEPVLMLGYFEPKIYKY